MLLWLADYLAQYYPFFKVFHYITVRAILAVLTSLTIAIAFGPVVINFLKKLKAGQIIRSCGPKTHLSKEGTPTMGGILILFSVTISSLLWTNLNNNYVLITLSVIWLFGFIGAIDDYCKIIGKNTSGLKAKAKFLLQMLIAMFAAILLYSIAKTPMETALLIPFAKNLSIQLGIFYLFFTCLVIVGSSNAVNLTDGLDGLAILPTVLVAAALAIFAYVAGHAEFSNYLAVPHIKGSGELAIVATSIVGAGLGFLWFNTYPAQVFMGDTGSLALGASLGILAVIVRQEIALFIMGGVFVLETISVILQVSSYKLRGKRIFRMAPLHHHFELLGWPEPKVIVRFWILALVFVLIGLASLKIR